MAIAWLCGVAAFSVLLGTVAESSTSDVSGSKSVDQAIKQLGGHGSPATAYLGLTFLVLALLIALMAPGQVNAIRTDEAEGYLDNLLVRPVSRTRWYTERLGLSALFLASAGVLAGIGAWAGASSQHGTVGLESLLEAGLNIIPPAIFLLGLGALIFGAWPRHASTTVYAYLAWSFLIEIAGGTVRINRWLLDTSVVFHMLPVPATNPDWSTAAIITALGLLGALLGSVLLRTRDLKSA
jgi:ABC-2 type transport system permease protein